MTVLSIIKKDLLLLLRDRSQLAVLFLTPLAFIIPISFAFPKDGYTLQADHKPLMPVVNYDTTLGADGALTAGEHAQALLTFLAETFDVESNFTSQTAQELDVAASECAQVSAACDELVATALVKGSRRDTAVVIPAGFSGAIDAGRKVTLTLYYDPAGDSIRRQVHEAVVTGGTMQLSIQNQVFSGMDQFQDLLTYAPSELKDSIAAQWDQSAVEEQSPALEVVTVTPANFTLQKRPDTYQQTVPGYTVMFVFYLITFLASSIKSERNSGVFRRLLTMPVGRSHLLAGKLFAALVVGVIQVSIMFAVGHFGFGMDLGQSFAALAMLTVALVLAAVGSGLAAAAFNLETILAVPLIVAALIGGCMFPVDWLPAFVRVLSYAIPHSWAMSGFQDIMVRGQGLVQVLPSIGVLLGFALVFFVVAVRNLEFE